MNAGKKAKWVVPVIGSIVAVSFAVVLLLPMLLMEPKHVPVALLSEDKGVYFEGETLNIGDSIVEKLTEEQSADSSFQ